MKNNLTLSLLIYALLIIPLVHFATPLFFNDGPQYVSTGEGSIIAQTNVYAQLAPYLFAYLSGPLALVWGFVRVWKQRKSH